MTTNLDNHLRTYLPHDGKYRHVEFDIAINPDDVLEFKERNVMTGREFYERLAKHLNTYDFTQDEKDSILQAAFEVAEGLDKEQN